MRPRYQKRQLVEWRGPLGSTMARRCSQGDGTVKRVRKWDVIEMKRDCPTRRLAQKELDWRLAEINSKGVAERSDLVLALEGRR